LKEFAKQILKSSGARCPQDYILTLQKVKINEKMTIGMFFCPILNTINLLHFALLNVTLIMYLIYLPLKRPQ